jgi:sugar phosphate isomerase/epimerase
MFNPSFSLNGAELLPIDAVCDSLSKFAYSGVELSLQHGQFDPPSNCDDRVEELRDYFASAAIKPVCTSTTTAKFLSSVPREPSLINVEEKDRARRGKPIGRGIVLAEKIGALLVSFQSGYVQDEHSGLSPDAALRTCGAIYRRGNSSASWRGTSCSAFRCGTLVRLNSFGMASMSGPCIVTGNN